MRRSRSARKNNSGELNNPEDVPVLERMMQEMGVE